MVAGLEHIRHPLRLHAELYSRLSRLMRSGYVARNPLDRFFQKQIAEADSQLTITEKRSDLRVTNPYGLKKKARRTRSEAGSVGKECASTGASGCARGHTKNKTEKEKLNY